MWSLHDLSEVFLGWRTNSLMVFQLLLFKLSFTRLWRIVLSSDSSCCTLHQSLSTILHVGLYIFVCLSQQYSRPCWSQRAWAILHMYAPCSHLHYMCEGVSCDAVACRGSLLSLVLLYLAICLQTHFLHAQTITNPIHLIYTHPAAFPLSLCLYGNLNNNSVCNNASNANPHRSERRVSCGSAACLAHTSKP